MFRDIGGKKALELYIHIPFCSKKCYYCDFSSEVSGDVLQKSYVNQLVEEIRTQGKIYTDRYISTIFIGGGTPSILKGTWVSNIMSAIYESFVVAASAEISIECNPGTVSADKLRFYRQSGINRISLGLQSANDEELKALGRIHTFSDFLESFQLVREVGFTNVNVDLMSAIPNQTLDSWKETLRKVVRLKPEHISAYSLIIEEGTPFYKKYAKMENRKELPDEDTERSMYYLTKEYLRANGYERYEISNYAKKGFECKHNIGYWTDVEYLGLGLGASSYVYNRRFHVERDIHNYLKIRMKRDITPLYQEIVELDEKAMMEEFMFLGLRLTRGVDLEQFAEKFRQDPFKIFYEPIKKFVNMELLEYSEPYLRLTDKGFDFSNLVMSEMLLD
jgi:hypothetical protein